MAKISMYSTKDEIRDYGNANGIPFAQISLAHIYALYIFANWSRGQIASHLDYAPSTVSTKRSQMWDYSEMAEELFFGEIEIAETTVIETTTTAEPTILYRKFRNGRSAVPMILMPTCGENIKNAEAVYFFKFYDETKLIFNKIGTTKKDVIGRLRDEIGDYVKKFDIRKVEIHRICACGNYPADGAESALRANFITRYSKEFCKNDRFFGVDIPTEIFDTVLNEYFASQTG